MQKWTEMEHQLNSEQLAIFEHNLEEYIFHPVMLAHYALMHHTDLFVDVLEETDIAAFYARRFPPGMNPWAPPTRCTRRVTAKVRILLISEIKQQVFRLLDDPEKLGKFVTTRLEDLPVSFPEIKMVEFFTKPEDDFFDQWFLFVGRILWVKNCYQRFYYHICWRDDEINPNRRPYSVDCLHHGTSSYMWMDDKDTPPLFLAHFKSDIPVEIEQSSITLGLLLMVPEILRYRGIDHLPRRYSPDRLLRSQEPAPESRFFEIIAKLPFDILELLSWMMIKEMV